MQKLVVITGTNASGKSGLAVKLAHKYDADIISADSRQVYAGLDLGSGKITKDEMQGVRHYLIDVAKPNEFFSLSHFQKLAYDSIDEVLSKNRVPILCGGTGLYINSVVDGYCLCDAAPDPGIRKQVESMSSEELIKLLRNKCPEVLLKLDLQNKRRLERAAEKAIVGSYDQPSSPRYECLVLGVTWPRKELYERIRVRLDLRLAEGMIEEVAKLREEGATDDFLYRLGLEYRYILMYLRGEFSDYDAFYDKLFMEIRHLAKEQMTWFRKRQDIHWIDMKDDPVSKCEELIDAFLD